MYDVKHMIGTILDLLFCTGRISYYSLKWVDGNKIDWTVGTNNEKYVGGVIDNILIDINDLRSFINAAIMAEDPDYVPPYTMDDLVKSADLAEECEDVSECTDEEDADE